MGAQTTLSEADRVALRLTVVPIDLADANHFVTEHHRHNDPMPGAKFSLAASDPAGKIVGVLIAGRPVARLSDDGWTLEVNRCCTDGTPNACSFLYRAAWRVTRELGYRRLITYTLDSESGASLRGANFKLVGERGGGSWNRKARPRLDTHPLQTKLLWECLTS